MEPDFETLTWCRTLPAFAPAEIRYGGGIATEHGDLIGVVKDSNDMLTFRAYQLAGRMFAARHQKWLCRREVPAALARRRWLDAQP